MLRLEHLVQGDDRLFGVLTLVELGAQEARIGVVRLERLDLGQHLFGVLGFAVTQQRQRVAQLDSHVFWCVFGGLCQPLRPALALHWHELLSKPRQLFVRELSELVVELGRLFTEHAAHDLLAGLAGAPLPQHLGQLVVAVVVGQHDQDLARGVVRGADVFELFGAGKGAAHVAERGQAVVAHGLEQLLIVLAHPLRPRDDRLVFGQAFGEPARHPRLRHLNVKNVAELVPQRHA